MIALSPAPIIECCTTETHSALKQSEMWAAIPELGRQPFPAIDDEPPMLLVMKNCPRCFSTLAVEMPIEGAR